MQLQELLERIPTKKSTDLNIIPNPYSAYDPFIGYDPFEEDYVTYLHIDVEHGEQSRILDMIDAWIYLNNYQTVREPKSIKEISTILQTNIQDTLKTVCFVSRENVEDLEEFRNSQYCALFVVEYYYDVEERSYLTKEQLKHTYQFYINGDIACRKYEDSEEATWEHELIPTQRHHVESYHSYEAVNNLKYLRKQLDVASRYKYIKDITSLNSIVVILEASKNIRFNNVRIFPAANMVGTECENKYYFTLSDIDTIYNFFQQASYRGIHDGMYCPLIVTQIIDKIAYSSSTSREKIIEWFSNDSIRFVDAFIYTE